ncbi:MAG: hypothetical protein KBB21_36220 [Nannocystaceae bacterium]|nr:hypothetical protein [Nannocystaceae bacterium]
MPSQLPAAPPATPSSPATTSSQLPPPPPVTGPTAAPSSAMPPAAVPTTPSAPLGAATDGTLEAPTTADEPAIEIVPDLGTAPVPPPVVLPLPATPPVVDAEQDPGDAERLRAYLESLLEPSSSQPEVASADRPWFAVKVLIGLLLLLVLAYLGGHPVVHRLERRLGVSRVVAAGFPFLALGLLSHRWEVLTDDVLGHLRPILHLALGWIGLVIGMRIELSKLAGLPRGTVTIIGVGTGIPLGMIVAGCTAVLMIARLLAGQPMLDVLIVRDALLLGAAGAIAADTETLRYGARRATREARRALVLLANLDELAALVGLAFLNAYFRPSGASVTWQLPHTAWLFVTFGLGLVVGVVIYAILRLPASRTESVALLLGSVAFAAGIASELYLSPLVVCFIVGMLLTNFPGDYKARLVDNLARLEMPIYLVFLIVAGAMWRPTTLGWLAMVVLLVARYVGRWLGGRVVWRKVDAELPADARRSLVFAPMGTLPIAVAVNAALLYPDGELPTILTATIGGAILCEIALSLLWRSDEPIGAQARQAHPRVEESA